MTGHTVLPESSFMRRLLLPLAVMVLVICGLGIPASGITPVAHADSAPPSASGPTVAWRDGHLAVDTPAVTPPGPPVIGIATAGPAGSGLATITFSPPASGGGSAITQYIVIAYDQTVTAGGERHWRE